MRARNLKPGLFKNEILGSADPLLTILFEGLWCMADREGRLEDRPLRLCASVFPYRRKVTEKKADVMLRWLHENGFIARYEIAGSRFIQVIEFSRHQNPHKNERPSEIPALSSIKHQTSTVPAPSRNGADTENGPSDSGKGPNRVGPPLSPPHTPPLTPPLTPDSLIPESRTLVRHACTDDQFDRVKAAYPKFSGRQDWITAAHHVGLRVEEGSTWEALVAAAERYRRWCDATGATGTRKVLAPANFFSAPDRPWTQAWDLPSATGDGSRDATDAAWATALAAIDRVRQSDRLTWEDARRDINEQATHAAIEAIGGYKLIADRTTFSAGDLKRRFREAFEREHLRRHDKQAGAA